MTVNSKKKEFALLGASCFHLERVDTNLEGVRHPLNIEVTKVVPLCPLDRVKSLSEKH